MTGAPVRSALHPTRAPARRQRGFTLLEVLVAMIVLSIGLIGLAGMQSASLRFNNDAYLRSQATALAYEMADRIRANARALDVDPAAYDKDWGDNGTERVNCGLVAGCSAAEMAEHDVFEWVDRMDELRIPLAVSQICRYTDPATLACNPAAGTLGHVIRIRWDGNRDGSVDPAVPDPTETIVVSFRP